MGGHNRRRHHSGNYGICTGPAWRCGLCRTARGRGLLQAE
ncbi:hypothetical protein GBAR_LOCUS15176 [Geodia barretti]|uniref:Uncharacterized protein n=1 Tax=Geodia barretti TaxID=519541 RepID=A0AA35SAE4_GEOBA|nr:hypothetical protein GBAR_LOCUS15176 [Geodia barretti]